MILLFGFYSEAETRRSLSVPHTRAAQWPSACRFTWLSFDVNQRPGSVDAMSDERRGPEQERQHMRFLSIYKTVERNVPPTPEEMARMGKLVEDAMKSGELLET